MNRSALRTSIAATASLLLTAGVGVSATATAAATAPAGSNDSPSWDVIAQGLNNPRQLTFNHDGTLYVAEAGTGGHGHCMPGEGGTVCFGRTGSVTQVRAHRQRRILTGLPSLAGQGTGAQASGPSDIALGKRHRFVVAIGLGHDPAVRKELPAAGRMMGKLVSVRWQNHRLRVRPFADIAGFEGRVNPVDDPDSNPVGVLRHRGGYAVTDAGGNTLVQARRSGNVRLIAAFPDRMVDAPPFLGMPAGSQMPMQAVPTSVAVGPDKALYLSQLTGFPFPPGAANIYRIVRGHAPTVYASGLTNVTDLAFGPHGGLYAVEIAGGGLLSAPEGELPKGALMRVPAGGGTAAVVADNLSAPYGIALRHGSAYLTTGSVAGGIGEVIRIPLHH